ncbi:ClpS-domain-containing protein [Coccomyxa subellipsoidea C-169]|uniref:ClpS-domain-containing protein n=1 Tax=Coccomyxa subellipsoidea (strain C-169) TaxID=574566 RepID=I0Z5R8_COCSC|nr:ClpS-domain-containing protein [Coccomyxa subellipsoidea C-169]EIE25987.1 ClpS-domain-containing protein [Coccomyxa subellipsoidea C-169]|eukprot:XP_005650531.1 ClpS-domain-containing protein [Coccomyxa subellipsoidea C-169]
MGVVGLPLSLRVPLQQDICRSSAANTTPFRKTGPGLKRPHASPRISCAAGSGGGVLDRPTTIGLPGFDLGKATTRQRPRFYRVMLHNDDFNRREYVVKVLLKVLDNFTMEDAINCMQEAHTNGVACLVSCPQEDAEKYCEGLRTNGLISTIEPAGNSGGGSGGDGPDAS